MKNLMILLGLLIVVPLTGMAQQFEGLDYVAPIKNNMIAIEKNGQWAFLDAIGDLVIDFSDKFVTTKHDSGHYPVFEDDRCLISKNKEGITYFGYCNTSGETVIEPQFLNATIFKNNKAIAILLKRTEIAKNVALGKPLVSYDYFEVLIDNIGVVLDYLTDAHHITLSEQNLVKPPAITSKFISENLIAVRNKNKTWTIKKVD